MPAAASPSSSIRPAGPKAGRLVLLARDRTGYERLCRIITHRRGKLRQSEDDRLDCLSADPRGVFFLTDDAAVIETLLRAGIALADVRFLLIRPDVLRFICVLSPSFPLPSVMDIFPLVKQ